MIAWCIAVLALSYDPVGDEHWKTIQPPIAFELPRDHGAHPDVRTEWWYFTGNVQDSEGRHFGYQLTFFRSGLRQDGAPEPSSRLRAREILAAHFAIADLREQRFTFSQRLRREAAGLAFASQSELHVRIEDWEAVRDARDQVTLSAKDLEQNMEIALRLTPEKALVRHGDAGISLKGSEPGNASAYLGWTRLATEGTLTVGGRPMQVSGTSWFDHEWGTTQLGADVAGWDWFAMQLDDGSDLMLYRLRTSDGRATPYSSGTWIDATGQSRRLTAKEFLLTPQSTWTSPHSKAAYPLEWSVHVPALSLTLNVSAPLRACELDTSATTGVTYWEGPIIITGTRTGLGYGEFTGYAGTMSGRF